MLKNDRIVKVAKKYDAQAGQILLSWGIHRSTSVIPKSENEERLRKNIDVSKGLVLVSVEF